MKKEDDGLDVIKVYTGEERFSPVDYHSFSIGGFTYTTKIQRDETPEEAFSRAWAFLQRMKKEKFPEARNDFYERMRKSRPTQQDRQRFDEE